MIFAMVSTQFNAKYQVVKARMEGNGKFFNVCRSNNVLAKEDNESDYVKSGTYDKDQKFVSKFKPKTVSLISSTKNTHKYLQRQNLEEGESEEIIWAPMLRMIYMWHLFAKLFLELLFVYFLYHLQSFQHPEVKLYSDLIILENYDFQLDLIYCLGNWYPENIHRSVQVRLPSPRSRFTRGHV